MNAYLKPVIVSGYSSQHLAEKIAREMGSRVVDVARKQFPDKEIQTTIQENVRARNVIVVASGSGDPNKQEKEARLLMRAANRAGSKSVTLLLPYMWYGRSDDVWDERNSPALTDTIETLREHCDNVVVADPHNHGLTREKFLDGNSPAKSCTTVHFAYPFAVQLSYLFNERVITPEALLLSHADSGSTKRISRSFRAALYNTLPLADRNPDQDDWPQGLKDRDKATNKSYYKGFTCDVAGRDVVIFEDMISSAGTACELADVLKRNGARSVILFATSGLFTLKKEDNQNDITASVGRINSSLLDAVYITDTYDHRNVDPEIHVAIEQSPIIHTIETAPFLASILSALHEEADSEDETHSNSIFAILRGDHPERQKMARPTGIKMDSPLRALAVK